MSESRGQKVQDRQITFAIMYCECQRETDVVDAVVSNGEDVRRV